MKRVKAKLDSHLVIDLRDCPTKAVQELKEKFTRSNPEFFKKKAMGFWTGNTKSKIRSFSIEGIFMELPRGAIATIEQLLKQHNAELEIQDRTVEFNKQDFRLTERSKLRQYQERAVESLIKSGGGVVRGPCGSGKTTVAIGAIQRIKQPALVVVHTKALAQQWRGAVSAWLGFHPGTIEAGKTNLRPVTIATQQSLWKLVEKGKLKTLNSFGLLIGDEIHRWGSRTFHALASASRSKYRIGVSADERRKDGLEFLIYETFGELVAEITQDELQCAGLRLPTRMEVVETGFFDSDYSDSLIRGEPPDYPGFITRLSEDEERREIILKKILEVFGK